MSEQITPLRQRMIDDMAIRNMSPLTQDAYIRAVKSFSLFFRRSPDKLTFEDVGNTSCTWSPAGSASSHQPDHVRLRFFYGTTLGKKDVAEQIPLPRRADPLPAILSRDEVARSSRRSRPQACERRSPRSTPPVCASPRWSGSRSTTSTAPGWSSTSARARDARTATSCCRSSCSRSCAPIGAARDRSTGCFPALTRTVRSRHGRCSGPAARRSKPPGSTSRSPCTPCGTASPPTCWSKASTSG